MPFQCPDCKRVSHHPEDARHGYCGHCHTFPENRAKRMQATKAPTNPYAPPCAGTGPCTEKGMAIEGFCKCKADSERLQDLTQRVAALEQVLSNAIDILQGELRRNQEMAMEELAQINHELGLDQ